MYRLTESRSQRKNFLRHIRHKKSIRKRMIGEINCGVSHGIKKPKPKTHLNVKKTNNNTEITNNIEDSTSIKENLLKDVKIQETNKSNTLSIQKMSSPDIESNNRFFKIKKLSNKNSAAVVTTSNNVKLKIASNSKMELNKNSFQNMKQANQQIEHLDTFDTTDFTLDESELEKTVEQSKIDNILKMLEDDWADDDYDVMDMVINKKFASISPLKPVAILKDVAPSSNELTNMTAAMIIKDNCALSSFENNNDKKISEIKAEHKYYPLFNKGYSANKVLTEIGNNKSIRDIKGNKSWQLSVKLNGSENQYQLDVGQKTFGATQCMECGVVYQVGDPEDENAHLNYHNNKKSLRFPGWKTERVIMEDPLTSSRIILIEPGDPKQCWKKVTDILTYVDRDLGLVDAKLSNYEQKRVYLYIRDKTILGVLVAEYITTAYRMIPDLLELNCCTAESITAKCGINIVWTDINHRRQGIATKLIDTLRGHFYFGYIMSVDDIAFSIPTPSGKIFAEKYTKTRNFKVYN